MFVSSIRLPGEDDSTARKKWSGLADRFDVRVIGFSNGGFVHRERFNCNFYGLPGHLWFPVRVLLYYLIVPWLTAYLTLRYSIDVWTAQGPYEAGAIGVVKYLLKPLAGPRLIIESHGDWIESTIQLRSLPFQDTVTAVLGTLSPLLLYPADGLRSVSEGTRAMLEKYASGNRPHLTFPAFINLELFLSSTLEEKRKQESPRLLYVGALTELKGVDLLLEALRLGRRTNSNLTLELCGEGNREQFDTQARQLGVRDAVTFHGEVPQQQLRQLYLRSRLLVLPSRTEALGRVLLESLACYTPFVATRTSGSEEVQAASNAGRIVPRNAPRRLADEMLDLFESERKRRELGERGRHYVENSYSGEEYFEHYARLVEQITSSPQTEDD